MSSNLILRVLLVLLVLLRLFSRRVPWTWTTWPLRLLWICRPFKLHHLCLVSCCTCLGWRLIVNRLIRNTRLSIFCWSTRWFYEQCTWCIIYICVTWGGRVTLADWSIGLSVTCVSVWHYSSLKMYILCWVFASCNRVIGDSFFLITAATLEFSRSFLKHYVREIMSTGSSSGMGYFCRRVVALFVETLSFVIQHLLESIVVLVSIHVTCEPALPFLLVLKTLEYFFLVLVVLLFVFILGIKIPFLGLILFLPMLLF